MIASTHLDEHAGRSLTEEALDRLLDRTFGANDWVTLALQSCERYLEPAIASGKPHRIANALRAIAHAPTPEQVDDVIDSVCDTLLAQAYSTRNAKMIGSLADVRTVILDVMTELNERSERDAVEPARLRESVDGLVRMAALADKRLGDRLDAVGSLAARIAAAMHLSHDVVLDTEFAARLHDVGLVSMPKDRSHKTHAVIGETFVASTPAIAHLAPLVRSHHERFDGLGFPDGLHAGEIPLPARIIGVAATFVELVTGTPRHKPLTPHDACLEVSAHSGSRFDPAVVTALLQLLHFRQQTNRTA